MEAVCSCATRGTAKTMRNAAAISEKRRRINFSFRPFFRDPLSPREERGVLTSCKTGVTICLHNRCSNWCHGTARRQRSVRSAAILAAGSPAFCRRASSPPDRPAGSRRSTRLQRNVAMLLRRVLVSLVAQHCEGGDHFAARETRLDDLVDVASLGSDVGIRELLFVLGDFLIAIE